MTSIELKSEDIDNNQSNVLDVEDNNEEAKYTSKAEGQLKPVKILSSSDVTESTLSSIKTFFSFMKKCFLYLILLSIVILYNIVYLIIIKYDKCKDTTHMCRLKYSVFDLLKRIYIVIGCGCLFGFISFILLLYKKNKILFLFYFNAIVLFLLDTGFTIQSFGGYVRYAILSIGLLSLCLYWLIYIAYKAFIKSKTLIGILYLFSGFVIYLTLHYYIFTYSCRDWKKGLGGVEIQNKDPTCITPKPQYCSFTILDGIFDLPYWLNQQCEKEEGDISLLIKAVPSVLRELFSDDDINRIEHSFDEEFKMSIITKKLPFIAFPRSEHYNRTSHTLYGKVQSYVLGNLLSGKNLTETIEKEKVEYYLVYNKTSKKYESKLDLLYNETLAKEKKIQFENAYREENEKYRNKTNLNQTSNGNIDFEELKLAPLTKNVLVFFSDATSRRHFFRKYSKTMAFLNKYYRNETSSLSSYQFMKHQALYAGTLANIGAAYFGTYNRNNGHSFIKKYQKFGFVTGATQNICSAELIDINEKELPNYEFVPDDHELWTPFCDPNLQSLMGFYTDFKGPYSVMKKCMWGKQSIDYSLEYARQFFEKYKDNNKFFRIGTSDSHETSAEVIKYVDESFVKLLEEFEEKKILEDTTVIIFSDHGTYSNGYYYRYFETADYEIELNLPGLFVLLPKKVKNFKLIDENIKSREHTMTTAFDIYKTLISILDGSEEKESFHKYGKGLFYSNEEESRDLNCKRYGTLDWVCMCKPIQNVTNY